MSSGDAQEEGGSTSPKRSRRIQDDASNSASQEDRGLQHDFDQFHLREVLDSSLKAKYVALLGHFNNTEGTNCAPAVLLLEKEAFPVEEFQSRLGQSLNLIGHADSADSEATGSSTSVMHNDIWHKYRVRLAPGYCSAKATLIHPATDRLIAKYRRQSVHLVEETPDDYARLTQPALANAASLHSLAWVQNLLNGTAERDRLVYDDPDPVNGFVLHADLKWDGQRRDDLYCLAVCRRQGVGSLRHLRGEEHLELLENLLRRGRTAIADKYKVPVSQLRIFLHYQPSFYHLHVHFTHLAADWPGQQAERAHLLTSVIDNLRLAPDYYQRATLAFPLKQGDALFDAYESRL